MIRRLLLAGVASSALACAAAAADLPVAPGQSYYPAAVTPVPYYDWTGIYIGGSVGALWATQSRALTTDIPTLAVSAVTSTHSTGFAGGGQVGFNWFMSPSFVFGVEGDFDALTNKATVNSLDGSNRHESKIEYFSTARGRFGLTADRFMFYLTGGAAWSRGEVTRTQLTGVVNLAPAGTVETVSYTRLGWTGGAGVEYAFAPNWTSRLQYLYARLDSVTYTFPLAQRTTVAPFEPVSELLFGVNYKFGGGGPIAVRD